MILNKNNNGSSFAQVGRRHHGYFRAGGTRLPAELRCATVHDSRDNEWHVECVGRRCCASSADLRAFIFRDFFPKIQTVLNTPTRLPNQVNTMTDLCMTLSAHSDSLPLGSAWVSRLLSLSLRHPTPSPQSNSNSDSTPPSIIQVRSSDAGTNSSKRASPYAQKAAPSRRSAQACASVPSLSSPSAR